VNLGWLGLAFAWIGLNAGPSFGQDLAVPGQTQNLSFSPEASRANSHYDPTEDLIAAFGGSCSSLGKNTLNALNQASSLKYVVESLKNDLSCTEVSQALQGVIESSSYMSNLLSPSYSSWRFNEKEAEISQLLAAIGVEQDPTVANSLSAQLALEKLEFIKLGFDRDYKRRELLYSAAGNYMLYSQQALTALGSQSGCIAKHPQLRFQIAGQILATSAALMVTPLGVAFFAAGNTVNYLVKYFSERGYNKLIKKATTSRLSVALGCVLESLSTSYCQARDTMALVQANANLENYSGSDGPEWDGITLLSRDISNYNTWIKRITAGSPPANQAAATQKSRGDLYEAGLRIARSKMLADLQTGEEREARAPQNQKANMRRLVLQDLENRIKGYLLEVGGSSFSTSSSEDISDQSPFFFTFLYDPKCGPRNYLLNGKHFITVTGTGTQAGCPPTV
jgi:hypothetical protein